MSAADDFWAIAAELSACVSLHRNGELDLERLIAVRDLARAARKAQEKRDEDRALYGEPAAGEDE